MLPSKWENLSRCSAKFVYFCKKLPLVLDCRKSKYYLFINIWLSFLILGVAFAVPFLCWFQKFPLLVECKFWNNFCCIALLFVWAQKVCFRFLKSYFKPKILIFLSFLMSFLVDMLTKKLLFWRKKTSAVKSETHFSRKTIEN